jgi:hypothetical protein
MAISFPLGIDAIYALHAVLTLVLIITDQFMHLSFDRYVVVDKNRFRKITTIMIVLFIIFTAARIYVQVLILINK